MGWGQPHQYISPFPPIQIKSTKFSRTKMISLQLQYIQRYIFPLTFWTLSTIELRPVISLDYWSGDDQWRHSSNLRKTNLGNRPPQIQPRSRSFHSPSKHLPRSSNNSSPSPLRSERLPFQLTNRDDNIRYAHVSKFGCEWTRVGCGQVASGHWKPAWIGPSARA